MGKLFNSGSHFDHVVDVEREVLDEVAHLVLQLFHLVPLGEVENLIEFLQGLFLKLDVLLLIKAQKVFKGFLGCILDHDYAFFLLLELDS